MRKTVLLLGLFLLSFPLFAQNYWQKTNLAGKQIKKENVNLAVDGLYSVDLTSLKAQLKSAPDRNSKGSPIIIYIPTTEGKIERFSVYHAPVMEKSMEDEYDLHSYAGTGIDDDKKYIRFNTSPTQFNSMIIDGKGKMQFIDPYTEDKSVYSVRERDYKGMKDFKCDTPVDSISLKTGTTHKTLSSDQKFRTYRLALSTTGEYTQIFGGTTAGALQQMNTTMTRVNGIYEKELAVNLIIQNFSTIIYTNAATDPYSNASSMNNWNMELQRTLTQVVGEANYDIGHLFGASGGGGNAGCIGCVCISPTIVDGVPTDEGKGSGFTSPATANQPYGDDFDVDFVAHEMGHQLGANHTFSFQLEGTGVNMEPGSGSTIMGYAGITNYNVQAHSDDYFHNASIAQISTNLQSKSCGTVDILPNNPPVVTVNGSSVTIPKGTRFYLDAAGTSDPDGDALTYCWEQNDNATSTVTTVSPTQTSGPIFRSFLPTTSTKRYFPALTSNASSPSTWETVSNVARTLNFRVTVRDNNANKPQTSYGDKQVIVSTAGGPFIITSPTLNYSVAKGGTVTVKWDVANTTASPFNTQNVKISLVTDNGNTIETLADNVPNNGEASVTLPSSVSAEKAKIMVEAVGNVFLALSDNFSIGYEAISTCKDYTYSGPAITIPDGSSQFTVVSVNIPTSDIGELNSIKASVNIDHQDISNLAIILQSPSPNWAQSILWNTNCYIPPTLYAGLNVTFDDNGTTRVCASPTVGNIKPVQALSNLYRNDYQGNWLLGVRDGYTGSTGKLNSFTLNICSITYKTLSTNEVETMESSLKVYPNPSSGKFQVNVGNETIKGKVTVKVYNMAGALLLQTQEINPEFSVDLTNQPAGVYILNLEINGKKVSKKLIKN